MLVALSSFKHWDVVALLVALLIVFVLEMMGVFGEQYVTITAVVRSYIPMWARAMILGWLVFHFLIDKANK
jgi:hypothetical protein